MTRILVLSGLIALSGCAHRGPGPNVQGSSRNDRPRRQLDDAAWPRPTSLPDQSSDWPFQPRESPTIVATRYGIRVRVLEATVEHMALHCPSSPPATTQLGLKIVLDLQPTDPRSKRDYRPWACNRAFGRSYPPCARLIDDLGNHYRPLDFGFYYLKGQVFYPAVLYGDQAPVRDILAFERPLSSAAFLQLQLPATNIGDKGVITLLIPQEHIQWSIDPASAPAAHVPQ